VFSIEINGAKATLVESGIRVAVLGEDTRFNRISTILRSTGRTFEMTAAALVAVELKHLAMLRRKGR